jgi:hypothetical protein
MSPFDKNYTPQVKVSPSKYAIAAAKIKNPKQAAWTNGRKDVKRGTKPNET